MKCLIVLTIALVAFVAANEESKLPDIKIDEQRCIRETGITPEQLKKLDRGQYSDEEEVRGHVLCILKHFDFFTEENGFDVEQVVARLKSSNIDEEKAREIATECVDRNEQGSTPAAYGYRVTQCLSAARRKINKNNN